VPDRESRHGLRTFGIGAQIMRDMNVGKARLLARPRKMPSMAGFSLTITGYDSEPPTS
jgi:3,4-dihydroxy 2-butanone 4-phosphate synthase/GTP cyclohydrolase II